MPRDATQQYYDDYELGNARMAAGSMRPQQMPQSYYDDYELGNARAAADSMRPQVDNTDYNDYELGNAREAAKSIAGMAKYGRGTDTMAAHVTPGDYVVPRAIIERDPAILSRIKKNFDEEGVDYRDHFVGHEMNNINPMTGQPEFKFLKKLRNIALPILGTIAGAAIGGPAGAAIGAGIGKKLTGASFKDAAITGATTYAGGKLLGSAGSGDVAGKLTTNAATRGIGEGLATGSIGGSVGQAVGGINYGQLAGSLQGQSLGNTIQGAMAPVEQPQMQGYQAPQENLDISNPNAMALPGTLSNLSGLSDIQRTSQIATQGTEGSGGVSREGQDYFVNQIRRRLNTTPAQGLLPIEGSYLNRLGVNYQPGNTRSILEGIARGGLNA
jgi:hypothetical protein